MDIKKVLPGLPQFPENALGLRRGSVLESTSEVTAQLGIKVGERFPIGFDGEYICVEGFTWSIEQLVKEIKEMGWWKILGHIDLSNPEWSVKFAREIEGIEIGNLH